MHWTDVYPHDLHASVLLLDGKIENWKVGDMPRATPGEFSGVWKNDRLKDYTAQTKTWTVNNAFEHDDVFSKHAPEWFRQWKHADDYCWNPAYSKTIRAITIHQPWATLIAIGEKQYETRGWPTKYRGLLGIHAGKRIDKDACEHESIKSVLAEHGYTVDNLPTGAVVAIAELTECWAVSRCLRGDVVLEKDGGNTMREDPIRKREEAFGWYDDGRFAWELTDIKQLPRPLLAKGQQGLWKWDAVL